MTTRARLPDRREASAVAFIHNNRRWTATIGRFEDGRLAELFLDGGKVDAVSELARESAIVVSLALQCGCSIEMLRHALAGRGEGPISSALALAACAPCPTQKEVGAVNADTEKSL